MATNKAGSSLYSYTVAPHLAAEFDVPLSDFAIAHPQQTHYVVGAFIFTHRLPPTSASRYVKEKHVSQSKSNKSTPALSSASSSPNSKPLMLIMQRASSDAWGGFWDFPGGSVEPSSDQTLLDGVAREVFEETGFHVRRIRELARVDAWTAHKRDLEYNVAKFSFVVDIHESVDTPDWEEKVRLAPSEHMKWLWVAAEEMEESARVMKGALEKPGVEETIPSYIFVGIQGETAWEGFKSYLRITGGEDKQAELHVAGSDTAKV